MNNMKLAKLIFLQVLALLGLLVGKMIAPEPPIYPTIPVENQYELIKYIEAHINLVTGFVVALISVPSSKVLKLHALSGVMTAAIAGILFYSIDSIRVGEVQAFSPFLATSYICGLAALVGLVKIIEDIISVKR